MRFCKQIRVSYWFHKHCWCVCPRCRQVLANSFSRSGCRLQVVAYRLSLKACHQDVVAKRLSLSNQAGCCEQRTRAILQVPRVRQPASVNLLVTICWNGWYANWKNIYIYIYMYISPCINYYIYIYRFLFKCICVCFIPLLYRYIIVSRSFVLAS